jgi:hypothetical protein
MRNIAYAYGPLSLIYYASVHQSCEEKGEKNKNGKKKENKV